MSADDERPPEGGESSEGPVDESGTAQGAGTSGGNGGDGTGGEGEPATDRTQPAATLLPSSAPDLGPGEEPENEGWLVRNPGWAALIAVVLGIAIGVVVGYLAFDSDDDTTDASDEETAALAEQVGTLQGDNEALTAQNEELAADLSASQDEVEQLRDRLDQMTGELAENVVIIGDFVGGNADDAVAAAEEQGWLVTVVSAESDTDAPGTVISQAPAAGAPMVRGSAVVLTVAVEPQPEPEPDVDLEYTSVQTFQGTGPQTTDSVTLPTAAAGAIRIAYQFQGDTQFTVELIGADDNVVATLADVQGSAGETVQDVADVPFAGSFAFRITTDNQTQWQMDLQALLPQSSPTTPTS